MWRVEDVVSSFAKRFPIINTALSSRYALHFAKIASDALNESFMAESIYRDMVARNLSCFYEVYHYKVDRLYHLV